MPFRSAPISPRSSIAELHVCSLLRCFCGFSRQRFPVLTAGARGGRRRQERRRFGVTCVATHSSGSSNSKGEEEENIEVWDGMEKQARSRLMELGQSLKVPAAEYNLIAESGPQHLKVFRYSVTFNGATVEGNFKSTKSAAKEAAANAFLKEHYWDRTMPLPSSSSSPVLVESAGKKRSFEQSRQGSSLPLPGVGTSSRGRGVELKENGVLVLVDLDNLPKTVAELDKYLLSNEDHNVGEVTAYASLAFNPGKALPEYVNFRKSSSLDRDSADILMVFETALRLDDLVARDTKKKKKVKGVVIVSKDHFATRLKEILCTYDVDCHHVVTTPDLIQRLKAM